MLRPRTLILWAVLGAPLLCGADCTLDFGNPAAQKEPAAAGALTTVRILDKDGRVQDWPLTGTAEGLVNGQRVSMPLEIVKLPGPGLRAVKWSKPSDGVWVLSLRVDDRAYYEKNGRDVMPLRGALASVLAGGVEPHSPLLPHAPTAKEVDEALARMAAKH